VLSNFGMPQQKLDGAQISCLFVYLGRFGPSHGMRSVNGTIESGARHPFLYDARILPGRNVRPRREAAREQILRCHGDPSVQPIQDRKPSLFGQLELDWAVGFLLDHDGAVAHAAADADVVHLQAHEIAASQLAVDSEIEHGEVALAAYELPANPYGPNVLRPQRTLLTEQVASVPCGVIAQSADEVGDAGYMSAEAAFHIRERVF
jgi:hypothetical protein